MRDLLHQIEAGLDANLYYLSLYVGLTIPDICGALDSKNGRAHGDKYKKWFNQYVAHRYRDSDSNKQLLTAEDCYFFRCSLLHQGSTQHLQSTYERIIFIEPEIPRRGVTLHMNVFDNALNIDVDLFCRDIITGAENWLGKVEHTNQFKDNYDRFMRRYPTGLPPYIDGVPVIS